MRAVTISMEWGSRARQHRGKAFLAISLTSDSHDHVITMVVWMGNRLLIQTFVIVISKICMLPVNENAYNTAI